MDQNETASFPLSSNNGGSTSSKETDDGCSWDHRPVFMFQPDIKAKAKELEPQPEMDLELRLCTRPSDCNGNGPVGKKMLPAVHRDEASCCWEPAGSVLLMTLDNRLCNSIAASHSSVASNSMIGVCSLGAEVLKSAFNDRLHCQFYGCEKAARGKSIFCIRHGGGRRCVMSGCTRAARGKTAFCSSHGGGRRCAVSGCTRFAKGRTDFCSNHGGGRRCGMSGCTRAARGKSGHCSRHGGGRICAMTSCTRAAEGPSGFCVSHGVAH